MQVQFHHIAGSKRLLRHIREEEFVDGALTGHANWTLLSALGMGCHHHAVQHPRRSNRDLRTVVETALESTFRTPLQLIWRELQTCLDKWMIKHAVFFAAGHEGDASKIGDHRPGAILPIKPEKRTFLRESVCSQIPTNGHEGLSQFLSVSTVPAVAKRTEPVVAMRLADGCPCSDDLPTLAAPVAGGTHVIQSA